MAVPKTANTSQFSGYYFVVAWLIVIFLVVFASRTKIGYSILYWFVIASIILVLSVGSPTIVNIFRNASPSPQGA